MSGRGGWPEGEGTEREIAVEACSIARGVGASIDPVRGRWSLEDKALRLAADRGAAKVAKGSW